MRRTERPRSAAAHPAVTSSTPHGPGRCGAHGVARPRSSARQQRTRPARRGSKRVRTERRRAPERARTRADRQGDSPARRTSLPARRRLAPHRRPGPGERCSRTAGVGESISGVGGRGRGSVAGRVPPRTGRPSRDRAGTFSPGCASPAPGAPGAGAGRACETGPDTTTGEWCPAPLSWSTPGAPGLRRRGTRCSRPPSGSRARSRSRPAAPRHRCPCRTRRGCSSRRRSSAARRRPRGPPPWAGPGCCGTG